MDLNLKGKTAIVGGGSKGLGKACAVALAREGVNIVLCARNKQSLIATEKELRLLGTNVLAVQADMSLASDNQMIVEQAVYEFGTIDILVNNSGGPKPGNFREITLHDLDDAYNSVFKYNVRMINLCLPFMEKSGWGRIVNITSVSVKEPIESLVLSNVFRSAVVSYAKTISKDLIRKGITINNVCPGYFKTDRITQLIKTNASLQDISETEYEEQMTASFPHRRYMNPQELGDYVCYICSDQARSITGTTVQIDGGLTHGLL